MNFLISQCILYCEGGKISIDSKLTKTPPKVGEEIDFEKFLVSVEGLKPVQVEAVALEEEKETPPVRSDPN